MTDSKVCPQCGAAITQERCPYCGIVFFDFACVDMNEPFFIKIKKDNMIHRYKVELTEILFKETPEPACFYGDNRAVMFSSTENSERQIGLKMKVLPTDKGALSWHVDTDIATGKVGEEWEDAPDQD